MVDGAKIPVPRNLRDGHGKLAEGIPRLDGRDASRIGGRHRAERLPALGALKAGATALVAEARRGFEKVLPDAKVVRQLYEVEI